MAVQNNNIELKKKAAKPRKKMGRPLARSEELIDTICEYLSDGESLVTICKRDDVPSASTVYKWLSEDDNFSDRYAREREAAADLYADETIRIADEPVTTELELARNRQRIEARHWFSGKLKGMYSDKSESPQVQVNIQQNANDYFEGME